MSVRLPLLGSAASSSPASAEAAPAAARVRVERRAITVCARDARVEPFARALAEGLRAHGARVACLDASVGAGSDAAAEALARALATPGALAVVCQRALAVALEGVLDVWVGPPPPPGAPEAQLGAFRSSQLELRAPSEALARLLAAELAARLC